MSDNALELARLWIQKAENDLVTARQTLLLPDGPTDTVGFHAQQAVEKSLKALLTFHQLDFPKTHDLVRLSDLAMRFVDDLGRFRERFAELSAYAVEIRYPGDWSEPSREEAQEALSSAEEVMNLLKQKLAESSSS